VRVSATAAATAALAVAATIPRASAGQEIRFRLGGVRATYADTVSGTAAVLTSRLMWDGRQTTGNLDESFTQFTSGTWAAQAAGSLFGIRLLTSHVALGIRADGNGGYLQGGTWSALGSVGPVLSMVAGDWIWSAGVAGGAVRRVDHSGDATMEAGITLRRDIGALGLQGGVLVTGAGPIRFADATLGMQLRAGPLVAGALAGARSGDLGGKPWLQGRVALRLVPWATLEAEAGSYPRDLSGFTAGAFVSVGVWLGGSSRPLRPLASSALGLPTTSDVSVETAADGHQRVTFYVPGAHQVAIAGEWNDWTPVSLERVEDSRWRAELALGIGTHRFSLVVDGKRWMVPPGVATLPDDMGGSVGLLIVDR